MKSQIIKKLDGKFLDRLKRSIATNPKINVGFPSGGPVEESGTPVALVAAVHEFGSQHVPERSFLRAGIRDGADQQVRLNRRNLAAVARNEMSVQEALGQLGEMAVSQVKQTIASGDFVPLKEATIARKGSSAPLIDTGQMHQSVAWEYEK